MTERQLLDYVDFAVESLEFQLDEARRQRDELQEYVAGKRRSKHRLGSIFYMKMGTWLTDMLTATERWESRYPGD